MDRDRGLDNLLSLESLGEISRAGHWLNVAVSLVEVTEDRPHGIKYSLTLHDKYGKRILGYDNAHAPDRPSGFKYAGVRFPFDHVHRAASTTAEPYSFESPEQLLTDFWNDVDEYLNTQGL